MSELVTRRLPFIRRKKEREVITGFLRGQETQVLFLEGAAGIGKTVLLEEAGRIAQDLGALCAPIIDFYDTEMHAHRALEAGIARSLDQENRSFQEYWARREQMERTLLPERKTLKEQQKELWELFLKGYNRVAEKQRVVLRFDTAERLEYEQDSPEVMTDCEVSPQDAPSWEWILKRISELNNTAVLIAARPTPTNLLKQKLLDAHGERVLPLEVKGFTLKETEAYFRATDFGRLVVDEAPKMVEKVHLLTEGRPILIALALDWLERGMWERHIYPASLEELKAWKEQAQAEESSGQQGEAWRKWDEIKRNFEIALVEQIRSLNHTHLDIAVQYATLARKGCNAELLSRLMGVSLTEAKRLVKQLLTLSFTKPPRGPRQLFFLHDEMYDLVERYIWLVDWPDYSEQARLDVTIIGWYKKQIEDLGEQMKACRDWRERAKLRTQQQLLIAERLYYQFDEDPREGYRQYIRLDEEAIGGREHAWDIWLRNEALWFTRQRTKRAQAGNLIRISNGESKRDPTIDFDCRRRWINRYTAQNETEKAFRIAEKLLSKAAREEEPELYRGGVQIALATAQAYMGGELLKPALQNFQDGIHLLENVPDEHKEPWLYPYLLGTAYLYQGLAFVNALQLNEAVRSNAHAINLFRSIDPKSRLAEALNNQSYVFVRQGRAEMAMALCEEALDIRQELGDEYSIGLSLNTKGIICERMDRPLTAIHNSAQALAIFKEINDERGIFLADINLGRSYRRKARSPEWEQQDVDFDTGKAHLEDALNNRQKSLGASADMFYRIEAHNEMGCLDRDWAATLLDEGAIDGKIHEYLNQAEYYLREAIKLTTDDHGQITIGQEVQHIDSLEDWARVYYLRARMTKPPDQAALAQMESLLNEAENKVKEYQERPEKWDELELILGKIYFQRARLASLRKDWDNVASYYAMAAGHIEGYSLDAPELRKVVEDSSKWLSTFSPKEAKQRIDQMHKALTEHQLKSKRLSKWVDSVVYSRLGVCWPEDEQEVEHG